ncbi:DMT family transporter [Azohydromonas lata]|uniref:DMT family transporter n=1 Tax=Azohydromonas lata TaxID=45677 RepID=A0ABU5IGU4_9BURK|nr:DMT family transporter [Azohydromonas lata]MDZ5458350.1 DMT family transporter [Azohydromonas lata]
MSPSQPTRQPAHLPLVSCLFLAASMTLVGSYVGLSKLLVAVFPVFLLAWLRFGIAAVAMAGWMRKPADEPTLGPAEKRLLFAQSLFGNFLFSICMLFGVQATSALAAGVTMAGIPAAVALLSWVMLKERITPRSAAGIACAVGGIALLAFARNAPGTASAPWWGYVLLLAAVFCEASYVVIGKRLTASLSPRRISALINAWGLALVTPLGLWQALSFDFTQVSAGSWGLLVFYALAASMVSVWLWMQGLKRVPAQQAGVFTVMLPLSAAAIGVLLLGEHMTAAHALACALALAGLLLATWPSRVLPGTASNSAKHPPAPAADKVG